MLVTRITMNKSHRGHQLRCACCSCLPEHEDQERKYSVICKYVNRSGMSTSWFRGTSSGNQGQFEWRWILNFKRLQKVAASVSCANRCFPIILFLFQNEKGFVELDQLDRIARL